MEQDFTKILFESIQCGVIVVDADTNKVIHINDVACNILQIDKSIIGQDCGRILCSEPDECQFRKDAKHIVKKDEICFMTKTQKRKWLLRTANKIEHNGKKYIIESFTDITGQKITEQNYIDLVHYAPAGIYEIDLHTYKHLTVNQVMLDYIEYTEEEFFELGLLGLLTEESKKLFFERMKKLNNGEQIDTEVEYEIISKSGKHYWILLNVKFLYNGDKLPHSAFCVVTNITTRKYMEENLRDEKNKAQMYLDMAFDIFVTLDLKGKIIQINKTGCTILKGNEQDLIGLNWFNWFVPEEDKIDAKKEFEETTKGINGDKERTWNNFIITLAGEKRYIRWKNKPIKDSNENIVGTFSAGDDITDQYKEEKQMNKIWDVTQLEMKQMQPQKAVFRKREKCPQLDCLDKAFQLVANGR